MSTAERESTDPMVSPDRRGTNGKAVEHGQDGGHPAAGCDDGSVNLHLSSNPSEAKMGLVETISTSRTGEKRTQTLQLDRDTTIDVTAKAEDGGKGGVGGDGGNGERGSKGRVSLGNLIRVSLIVLFYSHTHTLLY
jgi:hypothetical protein